MPDPQRRRKEADSYQPHQGKPAYEHGLSARERKEYGEACQIYLRDIARVRKLGETEPEKAVGKLELLLTEYERLPRPAFGKDPVYSGIRSAVSEIFQAAGSEAQKRMHKKVAELEKHTDIMLSDPSKEAKA